MRRILLTASGGPFRDWSAEALQDATPEQACAHPTWNMGRKISVDSATLMNKGLELIEASLLFGLPREQIEVVIHRQSVMHSLVEYVDGSVLAQLGSPDMRTPIAQALAWPQRLASGVQFLDLLQVARLDFEPPDLQRFPCLGLAMEAARAGGEMPAVLSAANEVAVAAFLEGRLNFGGIARVIGEVMNSWVSHGGKPDLRVGARGRRACAPARRGACCLQASRRGACALEPVLAASAGLPVCGGPAGHRARVRSLLGGAPARLQGAALLGGFRQGPVVAQGAAPTTPNTCWPPFRWAAT